jgi:hypothetical protein
MILAKYAIDVLIPDTPGAIRKLLAKSEFLKNETFRQLDHVEAQATWEPKKIINSQGDVEQLSNDDI